MNHRKHIDLDLMQDAKPRKREAGAMSDIIEKLLGKLPHLAKGFEKQAKQADDQSIVESWQELTEGSFPEGKVKARFEQGTLFLHCASSVVRHALSLRTSEYLDALSAKHPEVKRIFWT